MPSSNYRINSLRASIAREAALEALDNPSNFNLHQGVTFSTLVSVPGTSAHERPLTFDASAVDMQSSAINEMLAAEMALRKKENIDWSTIDLPAGCATVVPDDKAGNKLVLNNSRDDKLRELSLALKHLL